MIRKFTKCIKVDLRIGRRTPLSGLNHRYQLARKRQACYHVLHEDRLTLHYQASHRINGSWTRPLRRGRRGPGASCPWLAMMWVCRRWTGGRIRGLAGGVVVQDQVQVQVPGHGSAGELEEPQELLVAVPAV